MRTYEIKKSRKKVPSVTAITGLINKPLLIPWACKMMGNYIYDNTQDKESYNKMEINSLIRLGKRAYKDITEESTTTGTLTHEAIEGYLLFKKKPEIKKHPEIINPFKAFLKWKKTVELEVIDIERQVYFDGEFGYNGIADMICNLNGKRYILDLKTSNHIFDEYAYQLAAYRQTDEENIEGTMLVRLDKTTGDFEFKDFSEDYERDRDIFNSLCKAYHLMHQDKIRNSKPHKILS